MKFFSEIFYYLELFGYVCLYMYVMLSYSFDFTLFMSYFELFIALLLYYGNPTCSDLVKFTFRLIFVAVNSWFVGVTKLVEELF